MKAAKRKVTNPLRFVSSDSMGNTHYLVVCAKGVSLTSKSLVSLSLSNVADDAALLSFTLTDIYDAAATEREARDKILSALAAHTGREWKVVKT